MLVKPLDRVTVAKLVHSLKTLEPKVVTVFGSVMEVKLVHPLKAELPMDVTPFGILIASNWVQS
jgi:hypothetical protein